MGHVVTGLLKDRALGLGLFKGSDATHTTTNTNISTNTAGSTATSTPTTAATQATTTQVPASTTPLTANNDFIGATPIDTTPATDIPSVARKKKTGTGVSSLLGF